ncbi:MAG: acyl-CoA thioesterase [Alistipes sp.]|jgi:acyl-CoA thioester hydrolase|nr:acyl-CoA thioesterase [Alistipes sp.]
MTLITRDIPIRVRYNETDQMGIVHHSNYIFYYEVARTELMRSLGTSYKEMEERGALLVIRDVHSHFIAPAHYDEILNVRVTVNEMPTVKMTFDFEIFNEDGALIHTGQVVLACVDKATRRPKRVPEWFVALLR